MNELKYLSDFKEALKGYSTSDVGKAVLRDARLVLCSGATAAGRNTIIQELIKTGEYYFIISDTTREPRSNNGVMEKDGAPYWFRSEEDMLADIKAGKFVEAEIIHNQQVSGMSVREIEKANQQNKIAISDADRGGVAIVTAVKPDTICIFFLPPDFASWQQRIRQRGNMDPNELKRRMYTAKQELENALDQKYYHFIVNDVVSKAVKGVQKIVAGDVDERHEMYGRQVALDLLYQLSN